jgi:hypothetical protein
MKYDLDYFSGNDLKVPSEPSKPALKANHDVSDVRAYALALEGYEILCEEFYKELAMFHQCKQDRYAEFCRELRKDYGLCQAEFDVIWSEASDHAQSGSLNEAYVEFDRLFNFIKRYIHAMR